MGKAILIRSFLIILFTACALEFVFSRIITFTTHNTTEINIRSFDISVRGEAVYTDGGYKLGSDGVLIIKGIDQPIRTVYIKPDSSKSPRSSDMSITYTDENNTRSFTHTILRDYEKSHIVPIGAMGDASKIEIAFGSDVCLDEVILNKPIPPQYHILRFILLVTIPFVILCAKKTRFMQIEYNPDSKHHRYAAYAALAFFFAAVVLISYNSSYIVRDSNTQYNAVVSAIKERKPYLDIVPDESLINAENPYSPEYRAQNNIHAMLDYAYYNGKYYSYFGILPALILYLPFNVLTGMYLSDTHAVLLLILITAFGFCALWEKLVRRYLKELPLALYLSGLITLLFCSNMLLCASWTQIYQVAHVSALMFSVWGVLYLFRSVCEHTPEKQKNIYLFFGSMFLAAAVACRPTALVMSLVLPFIIYPTFASGENAPHEKKRQTSLYRKLLLIAAPYTFTALPLMWYNFIRFGSVFEFGAVYQMTGENVTVLTEIGVTGIMRRAFDGLFAYLFSSFRLSPHFPFVFAAPPTLYFTGHTQFNEIIGLAAFPVTWFLPAAFAFKVKTDALKPFIVSMLTAGAISIIMTGIVSSIWARYSIDFNWLFVLPSLLCMGMIHKLAKARGEASGRAILNLSLALTALSVYVSFAWSLVGDRDYIRLLSPEFYRYLADIFVIF